MHLIPAVSKGRKKGKSFHEGSTLLCLVGPSEENVLYVPQKHSYSLTVEQMIIGQQETTRSILKSATVLMIIHTHLTIILHSISNSCHCAS